jgi:membrane peptidoglycan carboxypeptidase
LRRRAAAAALAAVAALSAAAWLAWQTRGLPPADQLRGQLFEHRAPLGRGTWLPLWAIAPTLQTAVVAWEDPSFFFHSGLDYPEIARAVAINLRAGRYARGASTITQQVAKNLFVGPEKTLRRKVREAILARRLEQALTKDEILTVYLNVAEWGDGIVGAEAASRRYFGKSATALDWHEAALLAGILPNPRAWNPCSNPARARLERHAVLVELLATRLLQPAEFAAADAAPIGRCPRP